MSEFRPTTKVTLSEPEPSENQIEFEVDGPTSFLKIQVDSHGWVRLGFDHENMQEFLAASLAMLRGKP